MMAKSAVSQKVRAVKELTAVFWLERFVYVAIIVVCLIVLLATFVLTLCNGVDASMVTLMFGSGGAFTVTTGRLLHMYDKAIALLQEE